MRVTWRVVEGACLSASLGATADAGFAALRKSAAAKNAPAGIRSPQPVPTKDAADGTGELRDTRRK